MIQFEGDFIGSRFVGVFVLHMIATGWNDQLPGGSCTH